MEAIDVRALRYSAGTISDVVTDLLKSVPAIKDNPEASAVLSHWNAAGRGELTHDEVWPVLRLAYRYGFFEQLRNRGIPVIPYDLRTDISDVRALEELRPFGLFDGPPDVPLRDAPTEIAGLRVDFPLGLPASIIAAHSAWIEFFARRGFCILTYKTLRAELKQAHPRPNWMFLRDAVVSPNGSSDVVGSEDYWPMDPARASMANSFGIPSYHPDWWKADFEKARAFVREGHQVLIASVFATATESTDAVRTDFVRAAEIAARAGADIIELNLSCPNTHGELSGLLYTQPQAAVEVARAVKETLRATRTPLFVKIGYLPPSELTKLVVALAPHIDGVVAINTMTANVRAPDGEHAFPDADASTSRLVAGVSGWAIRGFAEQVAKQLVHLRREIFAQQGKKLTAISVGGVLSADDFDRRLQSGVDAVEICTGAFLNPHIGLEIRLDTSKQKDHTKQRFSKEPSTSEVDHTLDLSVPSNTSLTDAVRSGAANQVESIRKNAENLKMSEPGLLHTHMLKPSQLVGIGFESEAELEAFLVVFDEEIDNASYEIPNLTTAVVPLSLSEWSLDRSKRLGLHARLIRVKSPDDLSSEQRDRFEASRKARVVVGHSQ